MITKKSMFEALKELRDKWGIVIDEPIIGWLNVSDYKLRKIAKEVVDSILPERMKMEQEF